MSRGNSRANPQRSYPIRQGAAIVIRTRNQTSNRVLEVLAPPHSFSTNHAKRCQDTRLPARHSTGARHHFLQQKIRLRENTRHRNYSPPSSKLTEPAQFPRIEALSRITFKKPIARGNSQRNMQISAAALPAGSLLASHDGRVNVGHYPSFSCFKYPLRFQNANRFSTEL